LHVFHDVLCKPFDVDTLNFVFSDLKRFGIHVPHQQVKELLVIDLQETAVNSTLDLPLTDPAKQVVNCSRDNPKHLLLLDWVFKSKTAFLAKHSVCLPWPCLSVREDRLVVPI
jgi:hypothetical protein